jgi:RHS repeat-associated protein
VWDGAQTLLEIRTFASDTATAPTLENDHYTCPFLPAFCTYATRLGRVAYVHAGGVDAPLGAYRMNLPGFSGTIVALAPHANALGDPRTGSYIRGPCHGLETGTCGQPYPAVTWPGDNVTTDGLLTGGATYEAWYGTLLSQRSDGSRLQYRRHRYYDPETGRFTQQDPIGLAGGMNLYGFASGDPVNFGDPFGLNSDCRTNPLECLVRRTAQGAAIGGASVVAASVAGAPLTMGGTVAATPVTVPTGVAVGGLIGGAVGTAEVLSANAEAIADLTAAALSPLVRKGIELVGMLIGLRTNVQPPKRPDEPPPPPPPAPTAPKGPGDPPTLPPGVRIGP